jgi:hypothetical protein
MEVVEGKNKGNSDFRGVCIVKNGRMAKKNRIIGENGYPLEAWGTGQQANGYVFLY